MNDELTLVFRLVGILISTILIIKTIDDHPTIPTKNGVIFMVSAVAILGALYLVFLQRNDTP
jgi:uncharacterized membrane protein YqjE